MNNDYGFQINSNNAAQTHSTRRCQIVSEHPNIRALYGPARISFLVILILKICQLLLAYCMHYLSWPLVFLIAYAIGAVLVMGQLNMIHEASHNLIFASRRFNRIAAYVANLVIILPAAESIFQYHSRHHTKLGDYSSDISVPRKWEMKWVHRSIWRKLVWLLVFPLIYAYRLHLISRDSQSKHSHRTIPHGQLLTALNYACQCFFAFVIIYAWGLRSFAYLVFSFFFCFSIHPINAMNIQEHFIVNQNQPTYSYYGIANWITFNIGYHLEHHDLPQIPWNRIHLVKRIAPNFYRLAYAHKSWTKLLWRFITDRRIGVKNRIEPFVP